MGALTGLAVDKSNPLAAAIGVCEVVTGLAVDKSKGTIKSPRMIHL